jgi:hypothetical protein
MTVFYRQTVIAESTVAAIDDAVAIGFPAWDKFDICGFGCVIQ